MARAYIPGWAKARKEAIERSGGICAKCEKNIKAEGHTIEVNHIRALVDGGHPTDQENLETLCRPCHRPHSAEVVKRVAKQKRVAAKHNGTFRQPRGRKIQSRPMAKFYRPVNPANRNKPVDRRGKMS